MFNEHAKQTQDALIKAMKGEKNWIGYVQVTSDGRTRITLKKATKTQKEVGMVGVVMQQELKIPTP